MTQKISFIEELDAYQLIVVDEKTGLVAMTVIKSEDYDEKHKDVYFSLLEKRLKNANGNIITSTLGFILKVSIAGCVFYGIIKLFGGI